MERVATTNACHFFTACRPDRPSASYAIDFTTDEYLRYVPSFRNRCVLVGDRLERPGWKVTLTLAQQALVELVDGTRTIDHIRALTEEAVGLAVVRPAALGVRETFQSLWQLDFLAMGLPPTAE